MNRNRATLLAVLLAASTAHANVWQHAIDSDKPDRVAEDKYDSEMRQGDEHALLAGSSSASKPEVIRQLQLALDSYKAAAVAKPKDAEPHFRIGKLLYSFYFECVEPLPRRTQPNQCLTKSFDRERAKQVIAAWDGFEERAPLDPRLSVTVFGSTEILFDRAILHTKLATKADLAAAALDYEKLLSRYDGDDGDSNRVLGNLAETYMMIGRLEDALDTYRQALRAGSDTSTAYGYAVALDRDESSRQALDIIKSYGREELDRFERQVLDGTTFFVPEGEKFYYFALADEAFGMDEEAILSWNAYIKSGAHPEFQPRAKAHLEALMRRKTRRAIHVDPLWPELFR